MNNELFYTYEIYDPVLDMKYIGSRTKGVTDPYADDYMGSVVSKKWGPYWKEIAGRSHKRILSVFFNKEECLQHEIDLHNFFDVARNPEFFNQSKQKSKGFVGCKENFTEQARKNMSNALNGRRGSFKGKHHSQETKKNNSVLHKGRSCFNDGVREYKLFENDLNIVELSLQKGRLKSTLEKIAKSNTGKERKPVSQETKQLLSLKTKQSWIQRKKGN
jgi:hypothetical protein